MKFMAVILAACLFAVALAACGNAEELPGGDSARLQEIGEAFVDDIDKYVLPNRETPENLVAQGYVVFMDEKTYGETLLEDFAFAHGRGEDCSLTIVLVDNNFRVIRAVSEGGAGYYCRFEQDPSRPGAIPVGGDFFDTLKLERMREGIPRWELHITYSGQDVARFNLRYPTEFKTREQE